VSKYALKFACYRSETVSIIHRDICALGSLVPQIVYEHNDRPARKRNCMKMPIALSRRYRSNLGKTRGVLRYCDWTRHVDTEIIHQLAAKGSLTFFPDRAPPEDHEPIYGGLPRSGGVHCQIHSRTHFNDISLIYPAVPEKLEHYYDTIAGLEFTLFVNQSKLPFSGGQTRCSTTSQRRQTRTSSLSAAI
jgi:hypothetical protein